MAKRNPLITTIGFNKDDPNHVMVAEFLNQIGRGKANYIVKAVLYYQRVSDTEELQMGAASSLCYEDVRNIVMQVLQEQGIKKEPDRRKISEVKQQPQPEEHLLDDFDEGMMDGIMASLAAFQ